MSGFDELKRKAEELAGQHPEQVEQYSDEAVQRGGEAADKATGGRYDEKVQQGEEFLDGKING